MNKLLLIPVKEWKDRIINKIIQTINDIISYIINIGPGFETIIVEHLPDQGEKAVIYLLLKEKTEEGNYYDEYLWINNKWETIGNTKINLDDYTLRSDFEQESIHTAEFKQELDQRTTNNETDIRKLFENKQDNILDLENIRSGAALGATAIQKLDTNLNNIDEDGKSKIKEITNIIKHLLVYEDNKIKENGVELNFSAIYAILTNTEDFVALIYNNYKFYVTLISDTIISFTSNYLYNNEISTKCVNITSDNVVSYNSNKNIIMNKYNAVAFPGNTAEKEGTFAHGNACTVLNSYGHAEGSYTTAGWKSHAEGSTTNASGESSHAEGRSTIASGTQSHAEGDLTKAIAQASHAEGKSSVANGVQSHAEGTSCTTNAGTSHAEGNHCETGTNGGSAHAEGSYTNANGAASHTEGYRTITTEGGQHAQGCWNKAEGGVYAFMHGCGTSEEDRRNAFLITGDEIYIYGIGNYDGTNYGEEGVLNLRQYIQSLVQ